jgi:hypothetical protein
VRQREGVETESKKTGKTKGSQDSKDPQ